MFDVLQLTDECLLRRAARTRVPLDCSLVDHDCKGEAWVVFGLCHDQLGSFVHRIVRAVPVENHAVDSAANHVVNLILHLLWVAGTVADIHVVRIAKPKHHVGINLGGRSRIEQRVHVNLADVSRASVAVRKAGECVGCTRVVRNLSSESGGGHYIGRTRHTRGRDSQDDGCNSRVVSNHQSSGAEKSRGSCTRRPQGGRHARL